MIDICDYWNGRDIENVLDDHDQHFWQMERNWDWWLSERYGA